MRVLFVGDDWAEDHHDVEVVDETGRRLARVRLPEGLAGITRLHGLIATHMPAQWADLDPAEAAVKVRVGIETDRGSWVQALVAAGYQVYPINPVQVARYRQRHSTSGAKSDPGDAHVLAEIVRLDHTHVRREALFDSSGGERPLPLTLSQRGSEAGGSPIQEVLDVGGSSPDKAGTRQHCQMVWVRPA
jgi:hypothetical protein